MSGGKDSCYNMMQCVAAGHQIVALANLRPAESTGQTDELDSYMYQTVGHHAIDLYAEAMGLPLYRCFIKGTSVNTGRVYMMCQDDEVEDLYHLLKLVKDKEGVEGVSVGAILSDYQRVRVENVCKRLHLQPLAYLWRRKQEILLKEMISSNIEAIIIKVAAFGLDPDKHLGKTLDQMEPYLLEVSEKYGVHVCGEGGEYETFTLDCPLFKKKIVVDSAKVVMHSADAFAPVAYLHFLKMHLENKEKSSDTFMVNSCSCEVSCNDGDILPSSELDEPQNISPIIWKSLKHNSLDFSKTFGNSGKSVSGYQWFSCITAHFYPSKGKNAQEAAREAFSSLQATVTSEGLKLRDIILVHLYMKSMKDFNAINSVYVTEFDLCPPARVCVETLLPDGVLFCIDCLAHSCDISTNDVLSEEKLVMHVQSISHWAPASIGPYSQSIKVGDILYCAGQIGLVPCTMQLVSGGVWTEATVALSHVEKVLQAMSQKTTLHHVITAICYVTDSKHIPVAYSIWKKKLRDCKKVEDPETYNEVPAECGMLAVVVVTHLPRDAAIEWHVTAVVDDPLQRKHFAKKMLSEGFQIDCESVKSSSASCASVSVRLSLISPPTSQLDLDGPVHDLVSMFRQAVEKLSEDCSASPLSFRAFFKKDVFDIGTLQSERAYSDLALVKHLKEAGCQKCLAAAQCNTAQKAMVWSMHTQVTEMPEEAPMESPGLNV
ncbi:diphthine--ammonia ligase isoform X1 [Numida meleagris]|uniref:diphthine--ammonia ligase isoform X1 n=1 Tax=Numida meleagris TaxID=8996 RepID=UPI000B3DF770|nr:diphthine--ammonia ligase isoform X1 [Numida meleagris]XP_021257384.1 diphthine--ammonia ligase isoform X1 [Numida meleagris]